MPELTYAYLGGLEKREGDDGFPHIRGLATDETLDLDGQICDSKWAGPAIADWFKSGANMRAMHQPIAAGKAFELGAQGSGWYIDAKVVDADSALKVREDIFTGLSVGIKGAQVDKSPEALKRAPNGVIVGGKIIEVSLVDRPANPSCQMSLVKAAGMNAEAEMTDSLPDGNPPCPTCDGTGKGWDEKKTCETCGGSGEGEITVYPSLDGGDKEDGEVKTAKAGDPDCKTCHGKGTIKDGNVDCPDCVKKTVATDFFGYSEEDRSEWTPWQKGLMPDSYKKDYSDKERASMSSTGAAMPGGGYPIKTVQDLKNAIQAFGRAKDPTAAKAHIKSRAHALGQDALIPDSWKSSTALSGLVASLQKGATDDQWMHDPNELAATRDGLVSCIVAELGEFANGDDERWDVSQLTEALNTFLSWWDNEADEGETSSPFKGDSMSFVGLGVSADLTKAASAEDATDETKTEFKAEVLKSLGLEDVVTKAALEDIHKANQELADRLATVEKFAAPKGISLRATQFQQSRFAEVEQLSAKAADFKSIAIQSSDPDTRREYMEASIKTQSEADAIRKSLEGDK